MTNFVVYPIILIVIIITSVEVRLDNLFYIRSFRLIETNIHRYPSAYLHTFRTPLISLDG